MKRIIVSILLMVMMVAGLRVGSTYSREARVDKAEGNIVTFIDTTGNLWEWELTDSESYQEGESVKLIMSDMNTAGITDDEILEIRPE